MAAKAKRERAGRTQGRLVERLIDGPDGKPCTVTVNLGESPVSWLFARDMLSRRQFEAAECLRRDWERAALGPRVTMNWDVAAAPSGARRTAPAVQGRAVGDLAARERFHAALVTAGPGLADILWRVACACEGLSAAEQALGWPVRAGKLVLGFALDRVADYYRVR